MNIPQGSAGYLFLLTLITCGWGLAGARSLERLGSTSGRRRWAWFAISALLIGLGAWAALFTGLLGYRPDAALVFRPDGNFMAAMLGIALVGTPMALAMIVRAPIGQAACGIVAAAGLVGLHLAVVAALSGCVATHRPVSMVLALLAGGAALGLAARLNPRRTLPRAILMTAGLLGPHFLMVDGLSIEIARTAIINPTHAMTEALFVAGGALLLFSGAMVITISSSSIDAEHRAAEATSARSLRLLETALANMSNGLVMIDPDGRLLLFNDRVRELLGYEPGELREGMQLEHYLGLFGERQGWPAERLSRVISNHFTWMRGSQITRLEHRLQDGKVLGFSCQPMKDGGAILTYDDVTEERRVQASIEHMAYHDSLTGLPNRRNFQDEITRRMTGSPRLAVMLLDLDRFKVVNDTLGHAVGDQLLIAVAGRLREVCREADMIFRIGGDELAVIPWLPMEDALTQIGARLTDCFKDSFTVEGHAIRIACSIGVAVAKDADTSETLMRKADLALYQAKAKGRNRVELYADGLMERATERRRIESDLARALGAGEFLMNYQPIRSLPDGRLAGFEALIRWHHPERGLVSPADFIPLAEENGLIVQIGAWALEATCLQLIQWPEHLHVAVNISPAQIRAGSMVDQIAAVLARYAIDPGRLEIELTETALVEDSGQIAETLRSLRRSGVRVAMDDFGTGYSSLAHLRDFEIDRIKIDRSFVHTGADDLGSMAVVRAVVGMARDLAITTIGEGVETPEELARLIRFGCDAAQGYHLGRPMTAAAASALIAEETERANRRTGT